MDLDAKILELTGAIEERNLEKSLALVLEIQSAIDSGARPDWSKVSLKTQYFYGRPAAMNIHFFKATEYRIHTYKNDIGRTMFSGFWNGSPITAAFEDRAHVEKYVRAQYDKHRGAARLIYCDVAARLETILGEKTK